MGEKRPLTFSFPDEKVEESKAKRPRFDEVQNGDDAMDVDVKEQDSYEDEYTRRFKSLSDREFQLNKDLSLLKSGAPCVPSPSIMPSFSAFLFVFRFRFLCGAFVGRLSALYALPVCRAFLPTECLYSFTLLSFL